MKRDFDPRWPHGWQTEDGRDVVITGSHDGWWYGGVWDEYGSNVESKPGEFVPEKWMAETGAPWSYNNNALVNKPASKQKMKYSFWINFYPHGPSFVMHTTRDNADFSAVPSRLACRLFEGEIEEGEGI